MITTQIRKIASPAIACRPPRTSDIANQPPNPQTSTNSDPTWIQCTSGP